MTSTVRQWLLEGPVSLKLLFGDEGHHFRGGTLLRMKRRHGAHRRVNVVEEAAVAGAEVVEARLAVGGLEETVLGAAAVAGESHLAASAVVGKGVAFGGAELALLGAVDHFGKRLLAKVAELVLRVNEVVAAVEIAVVLDGEGVAAGFGVDSDAARSAEPFG